jgi:hypothetical protein
MWNTRKQLFEEKYMKKDSDLPSGDHPQWENLARAHAQHEREKYSFRSFVKRYALLEFDWKSVLGLVFLAGILITYHLMT